MSILLYSGLPGSGKSYGAVENVILPALKKNRIIVTNLKLKMGYLADDFPKAKVIQFEMDQELGFFTFDNPLFQDNKGAVFVIDEAARYWPAGLRQNQLIGGTDKFFSRTQHCHFFGYISFLYQFSYTRCNLHSILTH